jgi:hypothetical protein
MEGRSLFEACPERRHRRRRLPWTRGPRGDISELEQACVLDPSAARRRRSEQEPHLKGVPEFPVRTPEMLGTTALLDEATLGVERDGGRVMREDAEA